MNMISPITEEAGAISGGGRSGGMLAPRELQLLRDDLPRLQHVGGPVELRSDDRQARGRD